jgi:hypothetical protein
VASFAAFGQSLSTYPPAYIGSALTVQSTVAVGSSLSVFGDLNFLHPLSIAEQLVVGSGMSVFGDSFLTGDALSCSGISCAGIRLQGGSIYGESLSSSGSTVLSGTVSASGTTAHVNGSLSVAGASGFGQSFRLKSFAELGSTCYCLRSPLSEKLSLRWD